MEKFADEICAMYEGHCWWQQPACRLSMIRLPAAIVANGPAITRTVDSFEFNKAVYIGELISCDWSQGKPRVISKDWKLSERLYDENQEEI